MKRLLMATDLSPRSDRALNRALALSDELKAQLVVLHVVDEELPSSVADRLKETAESAIDDQLDSFPTLKRENITRKVVFGTGFRDILKEAEKSETELIIMGTHRDESLGDLFLGTTVERVIRRGNDPVLVVKNRVKGPYRRVLIGVDFSVYSRRAVEFALKFVPQGEIFLVHAFDVPFKGFISGRSALEEVTKKHQEQMDAMLGEEMQAFLASLPSPPTSLKRIMLEGTVWEVIAGQVEKLRPDLLVVGTHGRTGMANALLGSVAEDLLSNPPCDVLAVKAW
jgi:nucleotide-binding universal stress UspA family protein